MGQSLWVALAHPAPFDPGTMLLASDGTVYIHSEPPAGGTAAWWKLTPDAKGSYINGTWKQLPSMPDGYDPLYFASAILPDGHMIVEGGEYLGGNPVWTKKGAEYNPVTNRWVKVAGETALLSGSQLSGLDQGAVYGDDVQSATNFPVVRITNTASGAVTYARTKQWSSVSVAPGTTSSTKFTIPRPRSRHVAPVPLGRASARRS